MDPTRTIRLAGRVLALVAAYVLVDRGLRRAVRLSPDAYEQWSLAAGMLEQLTRTGVAVLVAAAVLGRPSAWARRWTDLETGRSLRWLIVGVTALTAWTFATYDLNLYANQDHHLDRLLLVALAVGVWWRPGFVLPFLLLGLTLAWQFDSPAAAEYSWAEVALLFRVLSLFLALLLVTAWVPVAGSWLPRIEPWLPRVTLRDHFLVLLCVVASSYWASGLAKFQMGWPRLERLELLLPGAYAMGWLPWLDPESIGTLATQLASWRGVLIGLTLVVECGSLALAANRPLAVVLLASMTLFHAGVFAVSGILFFKWLPVLLGLIALLLQRRPPEWTRVFTPARFGVSLLLILTSGAWMRPTVLAWYDTPLTTRYRFSGVSADGGVRELPTFTFTPFADWLALGSLHALNPDPQLTFGWGITYDAEAARVLSRMETAEHALALERERGTVFHDEHYGRHFDAFVRRFVSGLNSRRTKQSVWSLVQPPPHLWSLSGAPAFDGRVALTQVVVTRESWFFDGRRPTKVATREIRRIDVLAPTGHGPGGALPQPVR